MTKRKDPEVDALARLLVQILHRGDATPEAEADCWRVAKVLLLMGYGRRQQ